MSGAKGEILVILTDTDTDTGHFFSTRRCRLEAVRTGVARPCS
jgi:hypothetical protein